MDAGVLTKREREVARLAATGATTRRIADDLYINPRTVESHLSAIYRKLGVANRAELAALIAAQSQLVGTSTDAAALGDRLAAPAVFVGRDTEMATLTDAITGAGTRSGNAVARVMFVEGEPGAGKSTLVAQALNVETTAGSQVLFGACHEEVRAPFGPVTDAVAGYLMASGGSGDLADVVGGNGGVLATLLPALADRLPAVSESLDQQVRARLTLDALRSTIIHAASTTPTVLVLEDLHWASSSTIALIERFVDDPPRVPLTIVGTFRDTEVVPGDPLFGMAAQAGHRDHVERIDLRGFTERDAVELYGRLGGSGVSNAGIESLRSATAGNALYLSSVLRDLAAGTTRDERPSSLQDLIVHRIAQLDDADVAVVEMAAVIGLDFDLDLLVEASELVGAVAPSTVAAALFHASTRGIVADSTNPNADFVFVHDVVRQAVLGRIASRRRARLHAAIGTVLADRDDDDPLMWPAVIDHLRRSPDKADVIRAAELAARLGGANIAVLAPDVAAGLLESVLEALPSGSDADRARLDVLRVLCDLHNLRLANAAHRAAVIDAVTLAERIGTPFDVAEILTHYRLLPETGVTDEEILMLADDAVAGLPTDDAEALRLRALIAGYALYHRSIGGAGFTVADDAEAALAEARRSGSRPAIGTLLYNLAAVLLGSPDVARMQEALVEFEPYRAEVAGSVDGHDGIRLAGCAALQLGDRVGFDRLHARLKRHAAMTRSRFLTSVGVMWDAVGASLDGRLDEAARANDELFALAAADPNVLLGWFVQLVSIRYEQGRLDETIDLIDATLAEHAELAPLQALTAWAHAGVDDFDSAWRIVEPMASTRFASVPDDWTHAASITWLAPTVIRRGTRDQVRLLADRLAPYSHQMVLVGSASDVLGAADRTLALLAARIGRGDRVNDLFLAAERLETDARAPLHAARSRLERARYLAQSGEPEDRKTAADLLESLAAESAEQGWVRMARAVSSSLT